MLSKRLKKHEYNQLKTTMRTRMNYASNQFPVKQKDAIDKNNGTLWYNEREIIANKPFWKLQQEKKNLIMMGYDKAKFKITY